MSIKTRKLLRAVTKNPVKKCSDRTNDRNSDYK